MLGDSKSLDSYDPEWGADLITALNVDHNASGVYFRENTPRTWAVGGTRITNAESSIDAWILEHAADARDNNWIFFLNWGANDVQLAIVEADWKASYKYVIDALLTKWPTGKIFITKPGRRDYAVECTALAAYIDDMVTDYGVSDPGQVYVGDDEQIWFENGDDYTTLSRLNDGVHYNDAGMAAKVVAQRVRVLAVLGY